MRRRILAWTMLSPGHYRDSTRRFEIRRVGKAWFLRDGASGFECRSFTHAKFTAKTIIRSEELAS